MESQSLFYDPLLPSAPIQGPSGVLLQGPPLWRDHVPPCRGLCEGGSGGLGAPLGWAGWAS